MWIRSMIFFGLSASCGCHSSQSPPTAATSEPTIKTPAVVQLTDKDWADYPKHVGERIEAVGVVSNTKCPYVCGIDVWDLDAYRGRRVKIRGILRETVVTQESIDQMRRTGPMVANRGAGRFYSLDGMEFEVLP